MTNVKNRKKKFNLKSFIGTALVYAVLILFALWVLLPFSLVLSTSFKSQLEANKLDFTWWPKEFTLQGYEKALNYDDGNGIYGGIPMIISGFINTLWIVIPPTILGLFSSAISAYAFAKLRFRFKNKMFALLLVTMMIPGTILLTPSFIIYNYIGWVDTPLPLMIPGMFGAATCVFFMRQFYSGIPTELIEAAEIDGMSYFGIFFKVMVPLSVPALLAQALLGFIGGYNDYLGPLIYLQTSDTPTLQITLNLLKNVFGMRNVPALMAATIISIIPTVTLYLFAQKRFVEGVATSGMKV